MAHGVDWQYYFNVVSTNWLHVILQLEMCHVMCNDMKKRSRLLLEN